MIKLMQRISFFYPNIPKENPAIAGLIDGFISRRR